MTKSTHHSFSTDLAEKYGVHCAIIIHHFQHWINHNKRTGRNCKDGKTWTYQTHKDISAWFPYLTEHQVRRIIDKLVTLRVLVKGNHNKFKMDKTIWYAFENEESFTIGTSANSTGCSPSSKGESARPIPDTKPKDKEDTVSETLSSFPKNHERKEAQPKKPFAQSLNREQRKLHDELIKYKPVWGDKLKSNDVCAWFLAKKWSLEQVKQGFAVYKQDAIEAESKNNQIGNMGGAVVQIIKKGRKVRNADSSMNREYAKRAADKNKSIEITERYVKFRAGNFKEEVYFNNPIKMFINMFDKNLRTLEFYA